MKLSGRNVLLVGLNSHSALTLVDRLHRSEFQCHFASHMRAATDVLSSLRVDLVLSITYLFRWNWPRPAGGFGPSPGYRVSLLARRK